MSCRRWEGPLTDFLPVLRVHCGSGTCALTQPACLCAVRCEQYGGDVLDEVPKARPLGAAVFQVHEVAALLLGEGAQAGTNGAAAKQQREVNTEPVEIRRALVGIAQCGWIEIRGRRAMDIEGVELEPHHHIAKRVHGLGMAQECQHFSWHGGVNCQVVARQHFAPPRMVSAQSNVTARRAENDDGRLDAPHRQVFIHAQPMRCFRLVGIEAAHRDKAVAVVRIDYGIERRHSAKHQQGGGQPGQAVAGAARHQNCQ